jgi:glutamine---fructose-6-phosphate transaminase (isomerizing)
MAEARGVYTFAEIMSQPQVWGKAVEAFQREVGALKALWDGRKFDRVIFTGCGSTHYLAQTGAALFQQLTGINARAYPASEIALFPDLVFLPNTTPLLITISRSGETTETVAAVRVFRERTSNPIVAVTCASDSTLGVQADLTFAIDEAQETSLAQTRSFASMLIVVEAIAASLAKRNDLDALSLLTPAVSRVLEQYHDLARQLGEDPLIERFFFLGSGTLYGIANEAMLKMKEMSLSYSEAFHMLEFRHGPMSMVNDHTLVVGLISEEASPQEASVLRQMRLRGAHVLALSEGEFGLEPDSPTHFVNLTSDLPHWARPVLYLPVLQLMAYYRALSRGQNPDRPANLEFVISLNASMT